MTLQLEGVFPPIPTPFDSHGDVAYHKLVENLERWNAYDLDGYVVLGSNGEAVYLNTEEKLRVWQEARQAIPPDKLLIAGTGCESTRESIALTQGAAEAGADAALVVTPHYYAGHITPNSLTRYYHALADAAPIPIMLYNVPKFTGVDMSADLIASLAQHPNIIGVKDSGGNVAKLADVMRQTGPEFQTLAGSAGFFLAGLTLGAVGGVMALANIAPRQCINMYQLFQAGELREAAKLQRRMVPVNAAVTAGFGIAGLKAAMDLLGYYGGPVRSPLLGLDEGAQGVLKAVLVEGNIL
jgi:4-hydroxy-2-oxoglutarate aldolase